MLRHRARGHSPEVSEAAAPPAASETQPLETKGSAPESASETAPQGSASEATPREELAVVATNGHANGHAETGNGKAAGNGGGTGNGGGAFTMSLGATKVSFQTQADAPSCAECGSNHGPQRQSLTVPELREHLRLQLRCESRQLEGRSDATGLHGVMLRPPAALIRT